MHEYVEGFEELEDEEDMEDFVGRSIQDDEQDDEGICRYEIGVALLCLHFDPVLFLICAS